MTGSPAVPAPDAAHKPKPILGVGDIVATALGVFFRRFPAVLLLSAPGALAITGIIYIIVFGFWEYLRDMLSMPRSEAEPLLVFLTASISLGVGAGLMAGPLSGLVQAYLRGRRTPIRQCIALMFRKTLLSVVIGIILAAGVLFILFVLALLPGRFVGLISVLMSLTAGMYFLTRWGQAVPIIPLERMGFSAVKRSNWLSEGYRWQGTFTFALIFVISIVFGGIVTAGLAIVVSYTWTELLKFSINNSLSETLILLDAGIGIAVVLSLFVITLSVCCARLIEIKEPPDIEDMIDVFE